ncbi:MAG: sigma-70 family RNA polymerase sigma factor [Opitutus sp.]
MLVHFVRKAWKENDAEGLELLIKALFRRIQASVAATIPNSRIADANSIRDEVVSRFMDRFARDCREGGVWLDYYEIQFEGAFAAFRTTILRQIGPSTSKTASLMGDGERSDENEIAPEVEKAAAEFFADAPSLFDDPAFRSALAPAINNLPPDQKTVIGLLLKGIPIDSKDPKTTTIARVLKCDERTVRNRRDRAFKALRKTLEEVKAHAAK